MIAPYWVNLGRSTRTALLIGAVTAQVAVLGAVGGAGTPPTALVTAELARALL